MVSIRTVSRRAPATTDRFDEDRGKCDAVSIGGGTSQQHATGQDGEPSEHNQSGVEVKVPVMSAPNALAQDSLPHCMIGGLTGGLQLPSL